ncbi:Peptide chain release factor RF1 [Gracilaria domingensis]|nr:Peptide chain release factor RF1 [Gracilaria domingensis]
MSSEDVEKLFSHLAPLVVRAKSKHDGIVQQRSSSSFDASEQAQLNELAPIASMTESLDVLHGQLRDAFQILEESDRGDDSEMRQLALDEIQMLQKEKRQLASQIMSHLLQKACNEEVELDQPHSTPESGTSSAILEVRAGAGGDEAALFVADLFAMYEKFALRKRWKSRVLSQSITSLGGLRELIMRISGPFVYETIRLEAGVHRVQRVPATETSGRVHTSTASVAVLRDDLQLAKRFALRESEVKFDVYRASGAGGQHVNKTESAVRATHIPTGLVATSQEDRSQHRNKAIALEALAARLAAKLAAEEAAKRVSERRAQLGSVMGERSDRIRTYNYQQRRVTDHRIVPSAGLLDIVLSAKEIIGDKSVGLDNVLQGGVELERLIEGVSRARELETLYVLIEEAKKVRSTTSDELGDKFGVGMEAV